MTYAARPSPFCRSGAACFAAALHAAIGLGLWIAPRGGTQDGRLKAGDEGHLVVVELHALPEGGAMRQATTPLPDTREPGAGTPQTLSRRSGPEHRLAASIPEPRSAARAVGSSSAATRDADGQERHDGSPALSGSEIQAYRTALLRHIEKFRRYPNEARLAGQQGVVRVQFEMTSAGAVVGAFVESSSGISVLDTEATSAIARAAPLPAAPAGWPDTFGVTLPIAFFLQ